MTKILFLAANPEDLIPLKLYEEIYEVSSEVRRAPFGDKFEFEPKASVRWRDISALLRIHKPDILHFSGHGSKSSDLYFVDEYRNSQRVDEKSIRTIFRHLKGNIRCVVLNACYSESQANEIAEYVDCVIGTSSKIADLEAIKFSLEFYRQLAAGQNVLVAYEVGCTHVLGGKSQVKLLHPYADVSKIRFVPSINLLTKVILGVIFTLIGLMLPSYLIYSATILTMNFFFANPEYFNMDVALRLKFAILLASCLGTIWGVLGIRFLVIPFLETTIAPLIIVLTGEGKPK